MKKRMILLLVIILTIGFASVSVNLILSGKTSVAFDKDNLQVIFTRVRLNNEESENIVISEDGKSFVYIADNLTNVGDTSNIEYDIKNQSSLYDASVVVSCSTDNGENIEYNGNTLNQLIEIKASEGYTDTLTTKLTKVNTSSNSLALKCSLIVNPLERDTIMLGKEYNVTFDSNGGSTIDSSVIVSYYEKYGELPVPTKEGNEFLGWYNDVGEKIDSSSLVKVKDNHTLIAKWNPLCPYEIGTTWDFDYTGSEQEFVVSDNCRGTYKVELWGAQGGGYCYSNQYSVGAYTVGDIKLNHDDKIYIYVGESSNVQGKATFNGGGIGYASNYNSEYATTGAFSGGGATDIRLVNGSWNNFNSLKSRIMVASGGGGDSTAGPIAGRNCAKDEYDTSVVGRSGGGLNGIDNYKGIHGATQTSGGTCNNSNYCGVGSFGKGGDSVANNHSNGGGGGGYYGGAADRSPYLYGTGGLVGGASGSSFISGHNGCDAIKEESTSSNIIHTGQPNHYLGYVFTNTKIIDGAGYAWTNVKGVQEQMPNPSGGYYNLGVGHSGNGYARITLVSID